MDKNNNLKASPNPKESLQKDGKGPSKSTHTRHHSPTKVNHLENEIKSAVLIMADGLERELEREAKLIYLQARREKLEDAGSKFGTLAGIFKNKYRKYTMEMIVIVVIALVAFFAFLYFKVFAEDN